MTRACILCGVAINRNSLWYCQPCYHKNHPRKSLETRFWSKVQKTDSCWNWTGSITPKGYAQISKTTGHPVLAHRIAYEIARGPIPEGLEIDHLCRNRACVNPYHLEAVTSRTNSLRGIGPSATNYRKTICKRDHPLTGNNIKIYRGMRFCKECIRVRSRKSYVKRQRD